MPTFHVRSRGATSVKRRKQDRTKQPDRDREPAVAYDEPNSGDDPDGDLDNEPIPLDMLGCALTEEFKPVKHDERLFQSLLEQFHRKYPVEIADMKREVKVRRVNVDEKRRIGDGGTVRIPRSFPPGCTPVIRVACATSGVASHRRRPRSAAAVGPGSPCCGASSCPLGPRARRPLNAARPPGGDHRHALPHGQGRSS